MTEKKFLKTFFVLLGFFLAVSLPVYCQTISEGWTYWGSASHNPRTRTITLTKAVNWQIGLAVQNAAFNSSEGLDVTFEFYAGGGTGADGIVFFLVDGETKSVTMGAAGACLGYAAGRSRNWGQTAVCEKNGIPNAYLGVGFDENGNFSGYTGVSGPCSGAQNLSPQSVTIRGSGNLKAGYNYLTNTSVAQYGGISGGWRWANIILTPEAVLTVKMSWDSKKSWVTVIDKFNIKVQKDQVPLPKTYKMGFSAATGSLNNYHYIRNISRD